MLYFDHIFVIGDVHGNLDVIPDFLKKNDLENCAVIVAGDFGMGFETRKKDLRRLLYLNDRLKTTKSVVYAVRGNHDDPTYYTGVFDTQYVKLVPDYTVLELNLLDILCVGGATSIDRTDRTCYTHGYGRNWWKDEVFVYDKDKVDKLGNVDIVVTHTAPHFAYPFVKNNLAYWINRDIHLNTDIAVERHDVTMLYQHLVEKGNHITKWFYGHFHMNNKLPYERTTFIVLGINEIQEIK